MLEMAGAPLAELMVIPVGVVAAVALELAAVPLDEDAAALLVAPDCRACNRSWAN